MPNRKGRKTFYTISELADLLEVNERTVRRWIIGNSLSAHRLGRQWRISEDDLSAFLAKRYHGAVPDVL